MSPFIDPESMQKQQKPNAAGWIIPAFIAFLFLCACLTARFSQAAYEWLRGLGLM